MPGTASPVEDTEGGVAKRRLPQTESVLAHPRIRRTLSRAGPGAWNVDCYATHGDR